MKAVVFEKFGGPEVLNLTEVLTPEAGPEEVLIRVRACGLNRLDLVTRAGRSAVKPALPHTGGIEVTGEIAGLGENVRKLELGQRVAAAPFLFCGTCENCMAGSETTCLSSRILGIDTNGGFAEYAVVPARNLVGIPESLSFEEAAALSLTAITAWRMLVSKAGVRPGETVLINAAGSGVGSAAISIAKLWGARVIAAASTSPKLQKAEGLGADEIINSTDENLMAAVNRLTNGRGADIVIELTGQDTWEVSLGCIARSGRLVVGGTITGNEGKLNLAGLLEREIMVIGSNGGTKDDLKQVLNLAEEGRITPVIDSVYSLEQTAEAQKKLEARDQFGKIIITPQNR